MSVATSNAAVIRPPKSEADTKNERMDNQSDRKRLLDSSEKSKLMTFFNEVNQIRAEAMVGKKLLDQKLIRVGIETLQNETAALASAFDEAGSEMQVQAYVHPQQ